MKKIKILFTIPNFDTAGSQQVLLHIAKSLDRKKFAPEIACTNAHGAYFKTVENSGIPIHLFDFWSSLFPIRKLPGRIFQIYRRFRRIKPDIIHSFHWSSDFTECMAARLAGSKWVFTKKNMSWGNKSWKIRTFLAHGVVTINPEMKPLFFPWKKNAVCIPCSVNPSDFFPSPPDMRLRRELGIQDREKTVICVAHLVPVKGVETLIKALALLKTKGVKVILVGKANTDYAESLRSLAEKLGLGERVLMIGKKEHPNKYLNISDVFVLPTLNIKRGEGLGVALLEAMSAGLPVLGSNVSGIRFILRKIPELIFAPGCPEKLASKLDWLLNLSETDKALLVERLKERTNHCFSPEKEIRDHETFYAGLFTQPRFW